MGIEHSFSSLTTYSTCGQKYYLRYKKRYKSKHAPSALLFGGAVDKALNTLLETKDLEQAYAEFDKQWSFQTINDVYTAVKYSEHVVYAEADFDEDLLTAEQLPEVDDYYAILNKKKEIGWDAISVEAKQKFNSCCWLVMQAKGKIMLKSYAEKILPRIKQVLAVQKKNYVIGSDEEKIVQYLDLIVEWEDGRRILFDNKTSAKEYMDDEASRSPQLISYYVGCKEEYNLDSVGFLVLRKNIRKNKIKVCALCSYDGSGGRHKTCDNEVNGKRCHGEWAITTNPECDLQIIINSVSDNSQDIVMASFEDAVHGINKEHWYRNLNACKSGPIICDYYKLCWKKDFSDVVEKQIDNKPKP